MFYFCDYYQSIYMRYDRKRLGYVTPMSVCILELLWTQYNLKLQQLYKDHIYASEQKSQCTSCQPICNAHAIPILKIEIGIFVDVSMMCFQNN